MEPTKFTTIREFITLAGNAPEGDAAPRQFAMQRLIGPRIDARDTLETAQTAYLSTLSHVARAFDGASYQAGESYESMMKRIPASETGLRDVLGKLAADLKIA